jgi:hypothetical protein
MTVGRLEQIILDTIKRIDPDAFKMMESHKIRADLPLHIAEAVMQAYDRESGVEAEHHAADRFWNASSGTYDENGCW